MDAKDKEFLKRLRATFRIEAEEHIRTLRSSLFELEKTAEAERSAEIIEIVFREAHSLKGAARSVNLKDVESVCQPLESVFSALKRKGIVLSPGMCDLFHKTVNGIERLALAADPEQAATVEQAQTKELIRLLTNVSRGAAAPAKTKASEPARETQPSGIGEFRGHDPELKSEFQSFPRNSPQEPKSEPAERAPESKGEIESSPRNSPGIAETVRISTDKLAPLLLQAEEMISAKMSAGQRAAELREIEQALVLWKTEWTRLKSRRREESAPLLDKLIELNEARLNGFQHRIAELTQAVEQDQRALRRMVDEHLDAMKRILMLPVSSLVEGFPGFVRDLARDQGKEVELIIRGAEVEIDKRILDELKDPLLHIIRNCVDHGMKKPEERARENKPARGTITLGFSVKDSRSIEIIVSDDGAGVDVERVLSAAIKAGVLSPEAAGKLDAQEALSLIFQSGVTTSPIITDISGRGLGLAIVREKADKLGGLVSADSKAGAGTNFRLLLPLTLTTFQGILARVEGSVFILPTINTECVVRVNPDEVKTVENRETIKLNGQIISMVRLAEALELPMRNEAIPASGASAPDHITVVVLASGDKRIAFQVDEVLGELEILMKGLGAQLSRVRNIAGATVLGTGKVVPVINATDLMKSAVRSGGRAKTAAAEAKPAAGTGSLLVAEDSITSRMLIKNILETAGYRVATAVDGMDALTQVRSGEFDLVVSDVDMPRMSGFELTARIREDRKYAELPVVLVTALESREDRERGIEVGANAYIVKSSFDQSNLLEVIKKLI
ncbi:MAG: response regulator [bacterium]